MTPEAIKRLNEIKDWHDDILHQCDCTSTLSCNIAFLLQLNDELLKERSQLRKAVADLTQKVVDYKIMLSHGPGRH